MAQERIGPGEGNKNAVSEYRYYKANGTITVGDVVGFYLTAADGLTIDQCNVTTIPPIGVAMETKTTGKMVKVCVSGFCDNVTNDGTDIVAGDMLVGGAGVAIPKTLAEAQADAGGVGWLGQIFGQALEAATSTVSTGCIIYKRV